MIEVLLIVVGLLVIDSWFCLFFSLCVSLMLFYGKGFGLGEYMVSVCLGVGVDAYMFGLVRLVVFIALLVRVTRAATGLFILTMSRLTLFLFLCFTTDRLMLFYVYFESALVPILLIIVG